MTRSYFATVVLLAACNDPSAGRTRIQEQLAVIVAHAPPELAKLAGLHPISPDVIPICFGSDATLQQLRALDLADAPSNHKHLSPDLLAVKLLYQRHWRCDHATPDACAAWCVDTWRELDAALSSLHHPILPTRNARDP
jgi:hypothetical protein